MQADAFLFEQLVEPGDVGGRRGAHLRPHAAGAAPARRRDPRDPARGRRHRRRRARDRARARARGRSSPTSSPTSRTRPAARCRSRSASGCSSSRREHDFTIFEDDPYVELRFEGEPLPTMLSLDEADNVVYASSFSKTVCPGIRVGYLVGPTDADRRHPRRSARTPTSRRTWSPSRSSPSSADSGAIERSIETVKDALRERRDALAEALERHIPDARFVQAAGRLLPVGRPARGQRRRPRWPPRAEERGVVVRQGHRLPARGRRELASARLLRRVRRTRSRRASRASPRPTASWPARLRESAPAPAAARRGSAVP